MTAIRRYSISSKYEKKVFEVLDKWRQRKCNESGKICEAILFLNEDEEKGEKITKFTEKPKEITALHTAPLMSEDLTIHYLAKLEPKDLGRLQKKIYDNQKIIDAFIDSLEQFEVMKKKHDS